MYMVSVCMHACLSVHTSAHTHTLSHAHLQPTQVSLTRDHTVSHRCDIGVSNHVQVLPTHPRYQHKYDQLLAPGSTRARLLRRKMARRGLV